MIFEIQALIYVMQALMASNSQNSPQKLKSIKIHNSYTQIPKRVS